MSALRERLADGERVLGTFVTLDAPDVVELAGWVGLDFVVLDLEHGGLSTDAILPAARAADAAEIDLMVRVPEISRGPILSSLDAGGSGILIPQVDTADVAREAVDHARFPPRGKRGASLGRHARFGLDGVEASFRRANEETVVAVQCESPDAAANVGDMTEVDGLDVVFLGPFDYSASVGKPGDVGDPEVEEAAERIVEAAKERPVQPGVFVSDTDTLQRCFDQGFRFFVLSSDVHLLMDRFLNAQVSFDGLVSP